MNLAELQKQNPEAFRKLTKELQDKMVVPHSGGQQEVLEATQRFQVLDAGRRWGKTKIGAKKALKVARKDKQMVWWIAPTYKVVKRGYREVLRQLPNGVLTHEPPQDSAFDAGRSVILRFKNGSRMEFYSAERPEGMLGEGVDFAVLDEAAIMSKNIWDQIVRPTLIDRQGSALFISTPRARNWFYYMYLRGQDPEQKNYVSWKHPTSDNPYVHPDEIEEMRANMPLVMFQQEVMAEFVSSAGSVFRFNEEAMVQKVKPEGDVVVGIDLAKSNDFTVLYAFRASDHMPCGFDRFNDVSWPLQRNRIKGFVQRLHRDGAQHATLMMDSTGVGDPIVEDMQMAGYDVVPINFTKTKQHMVMQLSKDLEDGFVRFLPDYRDEVENYTYSVTDSGKFTYSAPEGQHDDVVSALMLAHWGIVQEGAPNIVALSAADDEPYTSAIEGEPDYEGYDDWSDLLDPDAAVDTGIPEPVVIAPDSPASIMGRSSAWS